MTADANNIDALFASFHRRIIAITINIVVAIPDTTSKAIGATELPSISVADAMTDSMQVPMPKKASVLFFILFY